MTPDPPVRDRRQLLLAPGASFNGIDYVSVAVNQLQLFVHFLNTVPVQGTLYGQQVTITGGDVITAVAVEPVGGDAWSADSEGRPVLALTVPASGDFSTYQLTIFSDRLDPFFSSAPFTFKANCPSTLDCATAQAAGQQDTTEPVPIDYLAKDFASFRQALSEFSTLRYPAWVERSPADLGVMLMEALAALADELSYYQDRVAAESTLPTATQRLSAVRHARMVDYEPAPGTVATTVLQLDVASAGSPPQDTGWTIDTPLLVRALGADGSVTDFEIEDPVTGLASPGAFTVDTRWNRGGLVPYYLDDSQRCLAAGSAGFYVLGHGLGLYPGQQLLLDTPAADSADAPVRELVTVTATVETFDLLIGVDTSPPQPLTQVSLQAPTTAAHDLDTTVIAGNIVPAVQGLRQSETFVIPDPALPPPGPVVVRAGANSTPQDPQPDYRYCLASGPLAWLASDVQDEDISVPAQPEILLTAAQANQAPDGQQSPWPFQRWLLGSAAADQVFTLTPERYSPVLTSNGTTWYDYDGGGGTTIRFGDGTFGAAPQPGTVFTVTYRTGGGSAGNVPADTIVNVAPGQAQGPMVVSCTNPFPASGGADAETITQVRARAPWKFSAEPLRAVQAADYATAARSLPWVQQAGASFRWTGSWLTVLTSANPVGTNSISAGQPTIAELESLTELLGRQRLAGVESYVLPPDYVSVDLQITVCGQPGAFGADVTAAVLAALQPGQAQGGTPGFFDHSRWSFGQPLESSALLAAIQACQGVAGVLGVQYRQRGVQAWAPLPDTLTAGVGQILRADNDPSRPEAGSVQVNVEGSG
jgi:hypothetical protein